MIRAIQFQGEDYLLIGDTEGPISKREDFENGRISYAHLMPDGDVCRFGQTIGKREDIVDQGETTANVAPDALAILLGFSDDSEEE